MRVSRSFAFTGLLAGAMLVTPDAATAQDTQTRSWQVCFTSAVGSCSEFFLTTAPTLSVSGDRVGTQVDVIVRHKNVGPRVTGLQAFTLYGVSTGGSTDESNAFITPQALNGAPAIPLDQGNRWVALGQVNEDDRTNVFENWLSFSSGFEVDNRQFIGGCDGAVFDADNVTAATTCGDEAYRLSFSSFGWMDASDIQRIGLDVYAGDGNGDFFPDVASCNASVDGSPGDGFDFGEADFTAACAVSPIRVSVPEPPTWWLLCAACAALAPLVVRNRRQRLWLSGTAALVALSACSGADAPSAPQAAVETPVVFSADLQAAVADASERVLPAIDVARQPMLRDALTELQEALQAGAPLRAQRAVDRLTALLPDDVTAGADAADLASLRMVIDASRATLTTAP